MLEGRKRMKLNKYKFKVNRIDKLCVNHKCFFIIISKISIFMWNSEWIASVINKDFSKLIL